MGLNLKGLDDKVNIDKVDSIGKTFEKFKQDLEIYGNRIEFEEFLNEYKKLSLNKEKMVEKQEIKKENTSITVIHTEYGPYVRVVKNGKIFVKEGETEPTVEGSIVIFTGIREVIDGSGEKSLVFLDELSIARTKNSVNDDVKGSAYIFGSSGKVLTKSGFKTNFDNVLEVDADQSKIRPNGETYEFINGIAKDFEEELKKAEKEDAEK